MVMIVLVGAVALVNAAMIKEKEVPRLKAKRHTINVRTNVKIASKTVMMIDLPILFLTSLSLKKSPALKAMNAKAISLTKLVCSIKSPGIKI